MEPVSEGERAGEWWAFSAHNSWEALGFPAYLQPANPRVRSLLWERWLSTLVDGNSLKRCLSPRLFPTGVSLLPPIPPEGLSPRLKVSAHSLFQLTFRGESGAEIPTPTQTAGPDLISWRESQINPSLQGPLASFTSLSLCLLSSHSLHLKCQGVLLVVWSAAPKGKRWLFFWAKCLS